MSRLPRLSGREVIDALCRGGFSISRVKGSHHILRHPDGRGTTVPVHAREVIGPGLLRRILRDCKMSDEELQQLLA